MKTGLILTIGSFGFFVLLLISYYLQQHVSNIGNKMYRLLLTIVTAIIVTEIFSAYSIIYGYIFRNKIL